MDSVLEVSNLRPHTAVSPTRDRVILSKGHGAMAYYAALKEWGMLSEESFRGYGEEGAALWGHVSKSNCAPAIDYSTGSLGHGLALSAGHALGYRLQGNQSRIFCILSDGECNEGSTWEAALFVGHHRLKNLTVLIDANGLQGLDECSRVIDLEPFAEKWRSFRFEVRDLDGHNWKDLVKALRTPSDGPRVLICRTVKGRGIPGMENRVASHYLSARVEDLERG